MYQARAEGCYRTKKLRSFMIIRIDPPTTQLVPPKKW